MDRFVIISGCSSGGKSTLIAELARRGYATAEEPGRRIVKEELAGDRRALPWVDGAAFSRRAIDISLADREAASGQPGWVFFDRGLIDAAAGLERTSGEPALAIYGPAHRYHHRVFLTPPWPEIYVKDAERRHDLEAAMEEYDRAFVVYPSQGYELIILPKIGVAERADFVLRTLGENL